MPGHSPALRAQIDPDTIEALDALIAEGTVSLPANKALAEPSASLAAYAWFKRRRSPELERTFVTLLIVESVLRDVPALNGFSLARNSQFAGWVNMLPRRSASARVSSRRRSGACDARVAHMTRRRAGDALRFDYSQFESLAKLIPDVGETIRPEDDDVEMLRIIRDQLQADGYGSRMRQTKEAIDQIISGGHKLETPLLWEGSVGEAIERIDSAANGSHSPCDRVAQIRRHGAGIEQTGKGVVRRARRLSMRWEKRNASATFESWLRICARMRAGRAGTIPGAICKSPRGSPGGRSPAAAGEYDVYARPGL